MPSEILEFIVAPDGHLIWASDAALASLGIVDGDLDGIDVGIGSNFRLPADHNGGTPRPSPEPGNGGDGAHEFRRRDGSHVRAVLLSVDPAADGWHVRFASIADAEADGHEPLHVILTRWREAERRLADALDSERAALEEEIVRLREAYHAAARARRG